MIKILFMVLIKKERNFEFVTEIFYVLRRENIDLCFQY